MIRILTNEFYPRSGGIATYAAEMAVALQRLGEEVVVSCPEFAGASPFPFQLERRRSRGTQDPDDLIRLCGLLRKHFSERDGSVLLLAEPAPIRALLLCQGLMDLSGKRIWLALFGSEIARMAASSFWRGRLRRLGRRVERIAVLSEFTRGIVEAAFPEWRDRIVVTLPGLPPDWQAGSPVERSQDAGPVRLLTAARLHPRKGQLPVIETLNGIPPAESGPLHYTLVGGGRSGAYADKLLRAAAACPHPVVLAGEKHGAELRDAFHSADIFIMASLPDPRSLESFGIVYLEAAAAGLPVIAADVGGVREALVAGETALLVPPGDAEALRQAILTLVRDPDLRRRMGSAGQRFARGFSWERSARRLLGT